MSSGFKTGWDYDDAPSHPVHGGKMTAAQAIERIAELEAALAMLCELHENRYACGAHYQQCFKDARKVLGAAAIRARASMRAEE